MGKSKILAFELGLFKIKESSRIKKKIDVSIIPKKN